MAIRITPGVSGKAVGVLTQTYSTATDTHANATSAALTNSTGAAADTTIVDMPSLQGLPAGMVSGERAAIRNNFSDLAEQIIALRNDLLNLKQFTNSIVDKMQTAGHFA